MMVYAVSQRLNSYFSASPEMRALSGHAGRLAALQASYANIAPAALVRFSHVQQFERQILVLAADNGPVAAKLRQLAPELILQLQNKGYEVTGIQVRVQVSAPPAPRAKKTKNRAGASAKLAAAVQELDDSELKNALKRLADKMR
jgi:hypothetical protein